MGDDMKTKLISSFLEFQLRPFRYHLSASDGDGGGDSDGDGNSDGDGECAVGGVVGEK